MSRLSAANISKFINDDEEKTVEHEETSFDGLNQHVDSHKVLQAMSSRLNTAEKLEEKNRVKVEIPALHEYKQSRHAGDTHRLKSSHRQASE